MTKHSMSAEELDEYFDNGGDISEYIVKSSIEFPNASEKPRKTNISMPEWMLAELDAIARHYAVSRQAIINLWIGERLASERSALS